ncbi:MAG: MBL fold metallo-hydrolase [Methanoregula sp.]|jgi:glyoxylase-like metal-dependent hydrolase (beta-lactamase superfamily II)|nr:MBL fold metallo-hydrolase [Methanoregula sp.]
MPNTPGSLHRAAEIIQKYEGNINRIQYDRRIDPSTVFYEVTASDVAFGKITQDLTQIGYLQTSLKPLNFLKVCVYLPHRPGALYEFLNFTTSVGANIAFIDFDDKGRHPDRLTVSLNLEQSSVIDQILDELKSRYRLEILEYDTTGKHLDDTVFYVRYAQAIRELIGESEENFLLTFLADTNHIVQELMDRGNDPRKVFESVLLTGKTMWATIQDGFYADVQKFQITEHTTFFCFQMPCGGNIFLISAAEEKVLIDTGYGIYHHDVMAMLSRYGLGGEHTLSRIIVTHADADHCGAAGYFTAPVFMHEGTLAIIKKNNRAYGSRSEHSVLEEFYTKMINLFSKFNSSDRIECFSKNSVTRRGIFPVIGTVSIGDIELEVLEGLGGHTYGQIYLYSQTEGLLFAADSVINFSSLTKERADYSSLAAFLVTSVNVDSDLAKKERKALLELAFQTDRALLTKGKRCLICGGHGAVSVLEENKLVTYGAINRYNPG